MDEQTIAGEIYEKILTTFPEARSYFDEEDKGLSYISIRNLAEWLESVPDCHADEDMVCRVKNFGDWAGNHPRGADAGDDVLTIYTVGFLEKLFESEKLIRLVPHLLTYDDLVAGKEYWTAWVGPTSYHWALTLCEREADVK